MSVIYNFKGIGATGKNVKEISVYISDSFLKLIKRTPALYQLFTQSQLNSLKSESRNKIKVNHYIYSRLKNLQDDDNFVIIE